jgi:hypothetical protein
MSVVNIARIPSGYWISAKHLTTLGENYSELKLAAENKILERRRSKKTRRVYYRSLNMDLL